jgi:two-component system sensor histidine kinase DegS
VLLSDLGLEPALESYLTELSRYSQLDIDFRMVGFEKRLDPEIETVLYRLAQEALTNTIKHARANQFKLSIIKSYPHIIFLVEDDGRGFDSAESEGKKQALGLLGMRERASMLGGSFSIRTSRGKGTRIDLSPSFWQTTTRLCDKVWPNYWRGNLASA